MILSTGGGGGGGRAWLGGSMVGEGLACMAGGHAWWGGIVAGVHVWRGGRDMCGWGHVWRGMHDRECVWQGTCVIGGVCDTHAPQADTTAMAYGQ